jgi:ABC-type transporter MlaC component
MKQIAAIVALALSCAAASVEAAEPPSSQDQQVLALVKEIQAQQAKIAENQAALDAKLATVAEAVRLARIYASRGGR